VRAVVNVQQVFRRSFADKWLVYPLILLFS